RPFSPCPPVPLSPCPLVSLSPCLPVPLSPLPEVPMSARTTHDITIRILAGIRDRLPDWESLDAADRELIAACCADAARLQLRALSAPQTADAQLRLLRDKAQ